MTRYEMYKKEGNKYVPFRSCSAPNEVFSHLAQTLTARYLLPASRRSACRIERRRCPYCESFDEIIVFDKLPNGDRIKTVFTVPGI